jgi:hypothetical protein
LSEPSHEANKLFDLGGKVALVTGGSRGIGFQSEALGEMGCAFPKTRGERPENFEKDQQFEAALFRAVVADPIVHRAMIEVGQLLQPQSLFHGPHIKQRIEAASAKTFARTV